MKIAFVTDDGKTISAHFGRAAYYLVVDVEDGKEVKREMIEKMGHTHFQADHQHEEHSDQPHGFSPEAKSRHAAMLDTMGDCSVVVCGGMGRGALQYIEDSGKEACLTEVRSIDEALKLYLAGNLPSRIELSH